jgi:oligopeptide/dipeptide ABC transporter ATP-binding protein
MLFDGQDILALDDAGFGVLRGARLAMIFQDPVASFNPAKRIGWHLHTIFARADKAKGRSAPAPWRERARAILHDVGIMRAEETIDLFPHQLSGGMLQRVLIALILALEPDLIVADEPTTNLDKLVERQVLRLFRDLQRRLSAAIVFITHDMATAASLCDRIAVMYAGQIVEIGRTRDVFEAPSHPYTQGLVRTSLALARGEGGRLAEIAGELPNPSQLPPGCLFEPRCDKAFGRCRVERPEPFPGPQARAVRCFLAEMEQEPS